MNSTVRVVADDREAASGMIEALRLHPDCDLQVRRLRLGDYLVDNRLLIERKTLRDLVVSIIDGRFLSQARRLISGPFRPLLLLEGTGRDIAESGMSREAIQGALITVTVMFGIPLLRSRDPEESAQLMVFAARQAAMLVSGALPRVGYRPKSRRALATSHSAGLAQRRTHPRRPPHRSLRNGRSCDRGSTGSSRSDRGAGSNAGPQDSVGGERADAEL